jgi:hypothetical protein
MEVALSVEPKEDVELTFDITCHNENSEEYSKQQEYKKIEDEAHNEAELLH